MIKNFPANAEDTETWIRSLGQVDPLEEKMSTHFSILAWEIPWPEEPGELQFMGSQSQRMHQLGSKAHHAILGYF